MVPPTDERGAVMFSSLSAPKKSLSPEDRHAVDLLLERPDGHGDTPIINQIFATPMRGHFENRLESVEKILDVLEAMPAAEPPADLVSRTLRRIEEASYEPAGTMSPQQVLSRDTRAHA
jgi:hypothetical protein